MGDKRRLVVIGNGKLGRGDSLSAALNALFPGAARRIEHWNMPTETARRAGATLAALVTTLAAASWTTTVLGQASDLKIALRYWTVQFSPAQTLFPPPSANRHGCSL